MTKRCIVVGASSRLGRAVTRELGARGARVGGTFFTNEIGGLLARRLDLSKVDEIERAIADLATELGGADALVVCATAASASAEPKFDRLSDIVPSRLVEMLAVNVAAPILCARAFAAVASTDAARNIVLVGSIDGAKPVPTAVPYAASKGALVAAARGLAKELGPSKILVNVVAPGLLDEGASRIVPDDVKKEYLKHSAAKRFGTHEEIARSIAWLALENTYVTAQTIILDGGL